MQLVRDQGSNLHLSFTKLLIPGRLGEIEIPVVNHPFSTRGVIIRSRLRGCNRSVGSNGAFGQLGALEAAPLILFGDSS
jgi:hypothetical protein